MPGNPIVWWELASHDAEKSAAFFRNVFGWALEWNPRLGFYTVAAGQAAALFEGGGIFTLRKAKLPFLALYIQVEDIEATAKAIEAAGGHLVEPPFETPTGSRICLFNEPSGATFALIEQKTTAD
jgi:uncharacterized protein